MQQLSTEGAFETLYKKYQEPITRALLTLVHDKERAVELCQDTFLLLLVELSRQDMTLKTDYHVKNWLYITAKHRAIDYLRSNKPIVYLSQSESEAESWPDEPVVEGIENEVIERYTDEEVLAAIARAIEKLPPKQRDSVKLRYIEGLPEKEAAAKLGITPKTVSSNVSRGIAQLRKKSIVVPDLEERRRVSRNIDQKIDSVIGRGYEIAYNVLEGYIKEDVLIKLSSFGAHELCAHELCAQELETLKESDQTSLDVERYFDRVIRKPLRRILIDFENWDRGLLSYSTKAGSCGQYLF